MHCSSHPCFITLSFATQIDLEAVSVGSVAKSKIMGVKMILANAAEPTLSIGQTCERVEPRASGNRGSCRVHSTKGPGPLASGCAAVFSVTLTILQRSNMDNKTFRKSPFCYWPDRIISKGLGLCFLIWIWVRGLKQHVFLFQVKLPVALSYF